MPDVLIESDLPNRTYRGKVRDTYDLGDKMLIVATDRISAADIVLPAGIPQKGRILTQLSAWWFGRIREVVPNHFIAVITAENKHLVPFELGPRYFGRSMLVKKAKRLDAECIARIGVEGLPAHGRCLWHPAPRGSARVGTSAGTDLHPQHEAGSRTRREHQLRTAGGARRRRRC
jgi:phosphoribosylaminoimidazole-succinocarboxamide synthase